jgi:hypothetical protein
MATPKTPATAPKAKAAPTAKIEITKLATAKPKVTEVATAAVKKATSPKKITTKTTRKVAPEEHYRMTEVAAYYIAERDGFAGNPSDYWIQAEVQINLLLKK